MIRRSNGHGGLRSRARRPESGEDVNPNSYLTNLADCMLVLTVGLMIALVSHYGVDLQAGTEVEQGRQVEQSELANGSGGEETSGSYSQIGTVYKDAETGKLYMVEEGGDE